MVCVQRGVELWGPMCTMNFWQYLETIASAFCPDFDGLGPPTTGSRLAQGIGFIRRDCGHRLGARVTSPFEIPYSDWSRLRQALHVLIEHDHHCRLCASGLRISSLPRLRLRTCCSRTLGLWCFGKSRGHSSPRSWVHPWLLRYVTAIAEALIQLSALPPHSQLLRRIPDSHHTPHYDSGK